MESGLFWPLSFVFHEKVLDCMQRSNSIRDRCYAEEPPPLETCQGKRQHPAPVVSSHLSPAISMFRLRRGAVEAIESFDMLLPHHGHAVGSLFWNF
jgi:hypothetical protein